MVFAINSAIHSYLMVSYANIDGTSIDVGFYYMANAADCLMGTILSGILFQTWGLLACLIGSMLFLIFAIGLTKQLVAFTSTS